MTEPTRARPPAAWQAPDGTHWHAHVYVGRAWLSPYRQDPETRQWHYADGASREITEAEFTGTFTPIPAEPMPEPRITRLTELVLALLDDYRQATGQPAATADAVRAALAEVAWIPLEMRKRALATAQMARSAGFQNGRRGR